MAKTILSAFAANGKLSFANGNGKNYMYSLISTKNANGGYYNASQGLKNRRIDQKLEDAIVDAIKSGKFRKDAKALHDLGELFEQVEKWPWPDLMSAAVRERGVDLEPEAAKTYFNKLALVVDKTHSTDYLRRELEKPQKANRMMGTSFQKFIDGSSVLRDAGFVFTDKVNIFKDSPKAVFIGSDAARQSLLEELYGTKTQKGFDFLAKIEDKAHKRTIVVAAEAKYISDVGGGQILQLQDALRFASLGKKRKPASARIRLYTVAVLDGIVYSQTNSFYKKVKQAKKDGLLISSIVCFESLLLDLASMAEPRKA
jgi:hypothetical protein